ncbi:hypothetical protein AB4Y77_01980 [Paenarthrobacter sp. YAF11_1]|uniref:hypothetical protein n=1 Tax=Paenarthrobacter sp. YAF11_1 TaxID=3233074 RepID=UPI003F964394
MENVTTGQHVTIDPKLAADHVSDSYAALTWTVEFVRPSKRDASLVSTDDAREGKASMRRIDRVPFDALVEAPEAITRHELVRSIAATLSLSLPDAASRVTFTTEELEMEGTAYTAAQAAEVERCIAGDVRRGK